MCTLAFVSVNGAAVPLVLAAWWFACLTCTKIVPDQVPSAFWVAPQVTTVPEATYATLCGVHLCDVLGAVDVFGAAGLLEWAG
jgi:hypothetical protein